MCEGAGRYCDGKLQVPRGTELSVRLMWMGGWDIRRAQEGKAR